MTNSSDIDNALIAKLASDPELLALCPNGVYYAEAPPGATRFVIVSLVIEIDVDVFGGGHAYEDALYTVTARMLSTSGGDANAAAQRIDELLQNSPLDVVGYSWVDCYREERVRDVEVDVVDAAVRWQHRGGRYRVQMSPLPPPPVEEIAAFVNLGVVGTLAEISEGESNHGNS